MTSETLEALALKCEQDALLSAQEVPDNTFRAFVWAALHPFRFGRVLGRMEAYRDVATSLRAIATKEAGK